MICPDMNEILIREDEHTIRMHEIAEPYIRDRREIRTLYRERNHPINCVRYTPDNPQAVIVLSHGFLESVKKYREMIYYFLHGGFVVYAFDHSEHGKSYRLTDDLSKVHVDDWHRWCDDLIYVAQFTRKAYPDLPLYLYGHSMGGGIGAAVLCLVPDLFSRAVLSSPMIRPQTGGVPWCLTRLLCNLTCAIGRKENYAPANYPYDSNEPFADSASLSEERFEYYMEQRRNDPLYQMSGATWGWLQNAVRMNTFIQKTGWKEIRCPVLLFQADDEQRVVNSQQDLFIKKISANCDARLIHMPETKHEIFNSHDDVIVRYLDEIFKFFQTG